MEFQRVGRTDHPLQSVYDYQSTCGAKNVKGVFFTDSDILHMSSTPLWVCILLETMSHQEVEKLEMYDKKLPWQANLQDDRSGKCEWVERGGLQRHLYGPYIPLHQAEVTSQVLYKAWKLETGVPRRPHPQFRLRLIHSSHWLKTFFKLIFENN